MEEISKLLVGLIPEILFKWRRHLRSARGETSGGAQLQQQMNECLEAIIGQVAAAISVGRFDFDACAAAGRKYAQARYQQQAKTNELVREIRLLRDYVWETIAAAGPIEPAAMLLAQTRAEGVFDEMAAAALESLVNRLRVEASEYDPVTQLYSRALFQRELEIELQRSARSGHRFALIMTSLVITLPAQANTRDARDCVISDLARLLKDKLRRTDRMFRYDDTQFAVICPETDATGLQTLTQRIALDVAQYRRRTGLDIDAQCGTASYPLDAQNSLSLIRVALADQSFNQTGIEC
jgi:diguanylate cyclase (GGDEF)-like protein